MGNWEFAVLQVSETVQPEDGRRLGIEFPLRNKGITCHQGHFPSTFETAQMEDGHWRGLLQLHSATSFHRTRTGQVQDFESAVESAVEHQLNLDIVLAICATACWRPPIPGSQIAGEIKLGRANQHSSRGTSFGYSRTNGYGDTVSKVSCKHCICH